MLNAHSFIAAIASIFAAWVLMLYVFARTAARSSVRRARRARPRR